MINAFSLPLRSESAWRSTHTASLQLSGADRFAALPPLCRVPWNHLGCCRYQRRPLIIPSRGAPSQLAERPARTPSEGAQTPPRRPWPPNLKQSTAIEARSRPGRRRTSSAAGAAAAGMAARPHVAAEAGLEALTAELVRHYRAVGHGTVPPALIEAIGASSLLRSPGLCPHEPSARTFDMSWDAAGQLYARTPLPCSATHIYAGPQLLQRPLSVHPFFGSMPMHLNCVHNNESLCCAAQPQMQSALQGT